MLFAARFNERLLGAVKIALQDDRAELQDLLVREVTRRRGVGLYLVQDAQRQLPQVAHWQLSTAGLAPRERGKSITSCAPAASHRRATSGKMTRRLAALVLIALGLAAVFLGRQQALRLASGWDQQVYVWQRVWTPQHADALAHSRDLFGGLRVLALQVHPREGWREIPADLSLLKQDGRPLWLVARLDGQLPQLDQEAIIQRLLALTQRWQATGLPVTGVEIDHDAATARLPDYQRFTAAAPTAAHRFATRHHRPAGLDRLAQPARRTATGRQFRPAGARGALAAAGAV